MTINELSYSIRGAAYKVHSSLGPGLFESVYERALAHELRKLGHKIETQVALPMIYDGIRLEEAFRIDLLVNEVIIVEIKSVDELAKIHFKQLITYLKLSDIRLGLLINFNSVSLTDKVSLFRVVNRLL